MFYTTFAHVPVPNFPWPLITLIFIVLFILFIFWGWYGCASRLRTILSAKPNLILDRIEPNVHDSAKIVTDTDNKKWLVGITPYYPTFTRIWIRNEPKKLELGVDAPGLHAEIEFYDEQKQKVLVSMSGRWCEVGETHDRLKTQQVTIQPNRKPWCLDVAMKYPDDDDLYGYDDIAHDLPDGRNPRTKFGKGVYFVKVVLACKGVNLPLFFRLNNPGKCHDVDFSATSCW